MTTHEFAVNARFLTRPATGVDRVAIELLKALAARGDVGKLTLFYPHSKVLYRDWLDELSFPVNQKFELIQLGHLRGHLWEQLELSRVLPERILLSLCTTGPILRKKQAIMIHDAQVWDAPESYSRAFRFVYKVLLPLVARRSQHLLTVSAFAAGRLEKLGISPAGKPKVIPNGADHILRINGDPETYARHGLQAGGYLLAIGSLAPHKNLKLLTRAAAARGPNAPELIVAGGMNSKVFADAGLRDLEGVRFIGRVTDSELIALYQGAIALAFPSLTEGFGLPPLEAMLCGCPVIATTGGAVPAICGDAALLVNPHDEKAWTVALENIVLNNNLRIKLSEAGLIRASNFSWETAAENVINSLA